MYRNAAHAQPKEILMRASVLTFAGMIALILASPSSSAAEKTATGRIIRFECGDNCYLVIKTKAGEELTGLCVAQTCRPWNEAAEMPAKYVGRRVAVTRGTGKQVDGSGNVMGDFPSFTSIRFFKKK
jgi:hypothetical protein